MDDTTTSADPAARRARALASLDGLSTANGYGRQFRRPENWPDGDFPGGLWTKPVYRPHHTDRFLAAAIEPPGPWQWTDDTGMACDIVAELVRHNTIDADRLTTAWTSHFRLPHDHRVATLDMLYGARDGGDWQSLSDRTPDGAGSHGTGAGMRSAPLGAWFADSLPIVVTRSRAAAELTHRHIDGVAGAVAVAVAAALTARHDIPDPAELVATVVDLTPDSEVKDRLRRIRKLGGTADLVQVAETVGNGRDRTAASTVPLAIWVAAWQRNDFPRSVRTVVSAGGDMDTTAAIVGGIVAAGHPDIGVPASWLRTREPLPAWLLP